MGNHLIDDVAKALAGSMPRRQALKLITGGLSAGILGFLGVRAASAAKCASNQTACGYGCCNNDTQVCLNGNKCCEKGSTVCKGSCCPPGSTCVSDGCCPPSRVVCFNKCCAPGEICKDGWCKPGSPSPS